MRQKTLNLLNKLSEGLCGCKPALEQRGWTKESYLSAWKSLAPDGKLRTCMKNVSDEIDDPAAYCMWLWTKAGKPPRD